MTTLKELFDESDKIIEGWKAYDPKSINAQTNIAFELGKKEGLLLGFELGKKEGLDEARELIRLRIACRQGGLFIDSQNKNGDYFKSAQNEMDKLYSQLSDLKYIISGITTKYLNDEQIKLFKELKSRATSSVGSQSQEKRKA